MKQSPPNQGRWWRFSLRELLLLMLAAGAFIGWGVLLYERSQPYEPSGLFKYLPYWRGQIDLALEDVGQTRPTPGDLPFTVTHARGPSVHHTESYSFFLPEEKRG